jgi:hypothetical protein
LHVVQIFWGVHCFPTSEAGLSSWVLRMLWQGYSLVGLVLHNCVVEIFWFWCSVSDTKSYLPGAAGSGNLETQECCFQSVPTWMQRWLQQGNLWRSSPNRCA